MALSREQQSIVDAIDTEELAKLALALGKFESTRPTPVAFPVCSMWRDNNFYNEVGIPSLTYGPTAGFSRAGVGAAGTGHFFITKQDLATAARIYALTAFDLCNQEKPAS